MEPDKVHRKTGHEGTQAEKWCSSTLSVTSVLRGMDVQNHAPTALRTVDIHGTHYTGDWVGPRAGLDVCGKSRPHWISILVLALLGGEEICIQRTSNGDVRETDHLEDPGVDGKII